MAQPKKGGINWKLYGGIAGAGLVVYFLAGGSPPAATTSAPAKKKKADVAGVTQLLPIDYTVTHDSFDGIGQPIKDTFVPIVYRSGPSPTDRPPKFQSDLTIPSNFTGGEANWAFDGSPEVNGKISALVENDTTGQSAYLHVGDKWKTSTVDGITENVLKLRDVSGATKDIRMQADVQAEIAKQQADLSELKVGASSNRTVNSPNAPLNPGMAGPIGGDISVQADDGSGQQVQQIGGQPGRGRRGGGGGGGRGLRGGGRGGGGNGGYGGFGG